MSLRGAVLALLMTSFPGWADEVPSVDPLDLIRRVVLAQRVAEERLASYTFDQREIEVKYAKDGRVKGTERRLYYVLSGENGEEGARELVEVDGRPATPEEKRKAGEADEKGRKKRLEKKAAEKASRPPKVAGDDEDPLVGTRRLSDLVSRFDYTQREDEVHDGRLFYVLDFWPRKEFKTRNLGETALLALAGRVLVDASDFQIRSVEARLIRPVKVVGGLAAKVSEGVVSYLAQPILPERWFPCVIDLRLKGTELLFFRIDAGYRFEFGNFKSFRVDTDSAVADTELVPPETPPR